MIETGVPSSLARPQTFHRFTYLRGGAGLQPLAQKIAIVGAMGAGGQGVAGTLYDIFSAEQADRLFVAGSEAALMVRTAYQMHRLAGKGPRIVAIGCTPPAGGAAATYTATVTGPADESGNVVMRVAGRRYKIGVSAEDTATDVAAAIVEMITRNAAELPVTAANVAGVVTFTYNHKGTNGNDVAIEVEDLPAGIAIVVADGVAGAGALDISAAYTELEGVEVDGIAISTHSSDDVEDLLEHVVAMWGIAEKRWRWGFIGETGTLGTASALAAAANDRAIVIGSVEGSPSLPCEVATALAVGMGSRERANALFNKMPVPIYPPRRGYSGAEVEAGIAAGLTILTPIERGRVVVGNQCKVERMVTTKTTEGAEPFLVCRDLAVPRTGAYLARQLDIRYEERFGASALPDGIVVDGTVEDRIGDLVAATWDAAERARLITNVAADLAELEVEEDEEVSGRFNVHTAQTVVIGPHQVAYDHHVKIGGGAE
jgi:phage tail sheath gpL-like